MDIQIAGHFYEVMHQDRITTIGAFPIGLGVDEILSEVSEGKTLKYKLGRESLYEKINNDRKNGRYVFGGLERCDYTKGLIERLGIFYNALNKLRSSEKDARFYQVTAPSSSENPDYQNLHAILGQEVMKMSSSKAEDR